MKQTYWCRIEFEGRSSLGYLDGIQIVLCEGELFDNPTPAGKAVYTDEVTWLPPVEPRQFLGLWNNFHERQQFEKTKIPDFPLFFVKLNGSISAHQCPITRPFGYSGRVKFEAELGIVIGQNCFQPDRDEVDDIIFGYTCINDITAADVLFANAEFPQWCRAKSFPSFGPIGPYIATGIDPASLRVHAILDGVTKQDYPVSDMIFSPQEIVWHIAHQAMLFAGDVITCGTSVNAGIIGDGQTIAIDIPGIGCLSNRLLPKMVGHTKDLQK
ncbi:MAG: fumarylacetoacetate hydrolase family protein [Desulfofustis sp.]|nr:fumarylacetoacetate hydrolase family protein [Desulfofustis sp.]